MSAFEAAAMSEVKHVKVDNWGVFFLQRLKSFFNRTDYCDLTLQFRDYAQLKVHRLVLSACTKYFELLERTCEMYENCLIMPDDLQADVVVPIVNFMYTGQLEYDYALFDRLYSTAQIMNMTVLTKLLDAQKVSPPERADPHRKEMIIMNERLGGSPYAKSTNDDVGRPVKTGVTPGRKYGPGPGRREHGWRASFSSDAEAARPTRYELPEGLESDDIFENSFADISYESSPIVKPQKRRNSQEPCAIYDEASSSRKFEELKRTLSNKMPRISLELPESRHFDFDQADDYSYRSKPQSETHSDDDNTDSFNSLVTNYQKPAVTTASSYQKESNDAIFNHISKYNVSSSKEPTKTDKSSNISLNHAKIISEVLKKYPHLVKSNKNIKLKIMTDNETNSHQSYVLEPNKKGYGSAISSMQKSQLKEDDSKPDWVYVPRSSNIDSMANLIALGAENKTGPWLCLICGTPSKALKFLTYNKYYRHLIDHHKEKVPPKICEYCGFKSGKRNHLLHHMYTKHDIPPPANYHFPKCNLCSYIALTEAFLIKHKLSHIDAKDFTCSVCNSSFKTRPQLLTHIQTSGHKISPDRRISTKCVYCSKVFLREANLYTHLKVSHKEQARNDGIIDNSDDEEDSKYIKNTTNPYNFEQEHVEIKEERNGKIQIISNTQLNKSFKNQQKLLNAELVDKVPERVKEYESPAKPYSKNEHSSGDQGLKSDTLGSVARSITSSINLVDVVVLNENEYILQNEEVSNEQNTKDEANSVETEEVIIPHVIESTSVQIEADLNTRVTKPNVLKPSTKVAQAVHDVINSQSQPLQIVVSGNQQYKAIVSSAPIIYSSSAKPAITSESNQLQNEVMVLNEEDFQIACSQSIPNDGSNIVLLYSSHPVENEKQFVQIAEQHYENESHEVETTAEENNLEEKDESVPPDNILVQESIETWQEETVIGTPVNILSKEIDEANINDEQIVENEVNVDHDNSVEKSNGDLSEVSNSHNEPETIVEHYDENAVESMETHDVIQDIETEENMEIDETAQTEELDDTVQEMEIDDSIHKTHEEAIVPENYEESDAQNNTEEVSTQNNELEISTQNNEVEISNQNNEVVESSNKNSEMEIINENSEVEISTQNNEEEVLTEKPETEINDKCEVKDKSETEEPTFKNEIQVQDDRLEKIVESNDSSLNKDEIVADWFDEMPTKEIKDSNRTASDTVLVTKIQNPSPELEESIENIQEEIEKQNQDEFVENQQINNLLSENHPVKMKISVANETADENEVPISNPKSNENNNEKAKSVEKISSLLNDWEDNDSQSEDITDVESKETSSVSYKDSNIDRLVSDWDEDEEK